MNAQVLFDAAQRAGARRPGRKTVLFNVRVPSDMPERIKRSAAKRNMSPSDYVRAVLELYSDVGED